MRLPAQPEHDFNKLITELQTINRQLAPFQMAMQPVQVRVTYRAMVAGRDEKHSEASLFGCLVA